MKLLLVLLSGVVALTLHPLHRSFARNLHPLPDSGGDEVQVRGAYDRTLGEMTQTVSVSRLGPIERKAHS
jgi:hypothetical protein